MEKCGVSKLNPYQANINSNDLYFKIHTYSKEESELIFNNYVKGNLKFTDNGIIQVTTNKTDPVTGDLKKDISHNFCNGDNLCLTDSGNIQ